MYVKTFESYNEELVVEKLNLQPLLDKLKNSFNKKTIAKLIVGSLLAVLTVTQTINYIDSLNLDNKVKTVLIETVSKYKDPLLLGISSFGFEHIKKHEKLKLKAYRLGDGKITVGYGHAEPRHKSKFKVGHRIDVNTANVLFDKDVKTAVDGIKRMFDQWRDEGVDIKVTQNQFDAMVSMAFNMGVTNFRSSGFVYRLKKKEFDKAAELIKVTGISDKFPGLETRRMAEYEMFIS
jgi:lysozyme